MSSRLTIVFSLVVLAAFVLVPNSYGALVAHFPLDDSTGDSVTGTSGAWSGNESYIDGAIGRAASFGGGSHIAVDFNPDYLVTQGSLSAWLQPTAGGGGRTVVQMPYDDGAAWDNPWTSFGIFHSAGQHVRGHTNSAGQYADTGGFGADPGELDQWHHAVVTNDGTDLSFYYDGVKSGSRGLPSSGSGIAYGGSPRLAIGERSTTALGEPFTGGVDDVRLYNHALSQAEVAALFNAGGGTTTQPEPEPQPAANITDNLVSYWSFDVDGRDSIGGRDATLQGDAVIAPGLVGNGLDLPTNTPGGGGALNGWAEAANDPAFDLAGDFSVHAWVYYDAAGQGGANESVLIEHFSDAGGPGWTITSFPHGGKDALFYGQNAVGIRSNSPSPTPNDAADNWTQYVVTRSGEAYKIYADGQLAGSGSGGSSTTQRDQPLLFGMRNSGDGRGFPLNGTLDEVAIWDRALTGDEIASLYNGGAGRSVPEPSTIGLILLGLIGLAVGRRNK